MKTFEYAVLRNWDRVEEKGLEGWELVAVRNDEAPAYSDAKYEPVYYLKRELTAPGTDTGSK